MKWLKRLLIVLFIIIVVLIIFFWNERPAPKLLNVEIKAPPGTKVFVTLPGGEEEYLKNVSTLDDGPITVGVPIDATDIILRYNSQEKVFPPDTWEEGVTVPVSIGVNAVPWAEVFIKSPEANEDSSYGHTPITVEVPIGAKVILRYNNKERVFPYEIWKDGKPISHNFLEP